MVESVSVFPLPKLRYDIFLTLDVMMHIKYQDAYNFMFAVNKQGRKFLKNNFITIRNGFINDGLISYEIEPTFDGFMKFEKLYFSALKRNIRNRLLTISIDLYSCSQLKYYNHVA
jgi:hypothetical protein